MNAITYGKNRIIREIPKEILQLTFLERHSLYNNNISLDEKIFNCIINPIVLMDTNLIGSISKRIALKKAIISYYQNDNYEYEYIVEIPDKIIDNKEIISLSQLMHSTSIGFAGNLSTSSLTNATTGLLGAHSSLGVVLTNRLEIIGRNMILVNTGNVQWNFENSILECGLAHDANMSHLKKGSYIDFGKLCVEAAKVYIYNKLLVKLDEGYILGGHNISVIKNKVENYESSIEKYDELLQEWFKIEFMNDEKAYLDFIELQIVR